MDKINLYRQLIQESLIKRAKLRSISDPVQSQLAWKNNNTRIYGCAIHVDIIGDKIWVQHDGTEDAIADELVAKGVPSKDIVLAYHSPYVRQYTEFAVG
jgi:hypothetical protein